MTKCEFKTVLEVLNIKNKIGFKEIQTGEKRAIYKWHDFKLYLSDYGNAVIEGKIPLEVAQNIYHEYPINQYSIKVNKGQIDDNPIEHANCDEFNKIYDNFLSDDNEFKKILLEKWKEKLIEVYQCNSFPLYIDGYHIESKDGLLIVLQELHNYYTKRFLYATKVFEPHFIEYNNFIETDLISETNKRLIEKGEFSKNKKQWLIDSVLYKYNNNNLLKTDEDYKIRELLNQFDRIVNPFIDNKKFDSSDFSKNVMLNFDINRNETSLSIRNTLTDHYITYSEGSNYIDYYLNRNGKYVNHHYSIDEKDGPTEYIHIYDYQKYYLIDDFFKSSMFPKPLKATTLDKQVLIEELEQAIIDAKSISLKKIKNDNKVIKLKK